MNPKIYKEIPRDSLIPEDRGEGGVRNKKVKFASTALLLVIACAFASSAFAADRHREAQQVDAIFAALGAKNEPGTAVMVIQNGRRVFSRGYGVRDLATVRANDAETNIRLASCTKQFTAMAIMLLVHDGKLRYNEPVTEVFPVFPAYGRGITIRNLLNHTSGLLDYEDLMPQTPDSALPVEHPGQIDNKIEQIQDSGVLALLKQQNKTKFAPGTHWAYSNSGYVLLGLVVAKVSGEPFGQFLHDRIFRPLGMKNTILYERGKNEVRNRAFGHSLRKPVLAWYGPALPRFMQTDQSPTSDTQGDGGVYSSLADLAKWDRALRDHTLLSEKEMQPAITPVEVPDHSVQEPDGTPAAYGFGWFLNPYQGHRRMWHYGETMGFRSSIQRFPDDNLTVIVLANRDDVEGQKLALEVADIYLK